MFGKKSTGQTERAAAALERLHGRSEMAFVRGNIGKGTRLAARTERARLSLESRTGRRWESYGNPVQD